MLLAYQTSTHTYVYIYLLDVTADVVHKQVMLLAYPCWCVACKACACNVLYDQIAAKLGPEFMIM